jgi:hypothetical protein
MSRSYVAAVTCLLMGVWKHWRSTMKFVGNTALSLKNFEPSARDALRKAVRSKRIRNDRKDR